MSELSELIKTEIAAGGSVTFTRFMELALYYPGLGYYESAQNRVGFKGDFYTSVSTGELFGQLLAFRFAAWLAKLPPETGPVRIVEAGAHDGQLAHDIMGWLRQHRAALFEKLEYWLVEPSPRRRQWQEEKLADFRGKIRWAQSLDALAGSAPNPARPANATNALNGIIFSNELLDAMAVHRLGWDAARQEWFEWGVAWDGDQFIWANLPSPVGLEAAIHLPLELLRVLPDGYTVETCPAAAQWWHAAADILGQGWLMTIDYGFTAQEMIQPGRTKGTVRAYFKHQLSDDLLANVGSQDLTAHVNFTDVQVAGENAGLKTEGYLTQPQFLTAILTDAIKDEAFRDWNGSRTRQFQTLTHPEHLGRAFKVLVQSRLPC